MTTRLRNNLIAGLIVLVFLLFVASKSMAETTTVEQTTNSTVTTNGNQTTKV